LFNFPSIDRLSDQAARDAPLRNQLITKGLVHSPSHGITDFTVPQFDDFLRRCFPFTRASKTAKRG